MKTNINVKTVTNIYVYKHDFVPVLPYFKQQNTVIQHSTTDKQGFLGGMGRYN